MSVDPVVELCNKYVAELWEAAMTVKDRVQHFHTDFSETVEQWKHDLDEMKEQIREMMKDVADESPLDRDFDFGQVLSTFTWIGILLLAMSIGGVIGNVLSPLVNCIIGESTALLLALVLLPAFLHSELAKQIKEDDENDIFRRHSLLVFSFVEGFLIGFAFSARVLVNVPPLAALSAFAIAVPTQMYQDYIDDSRKSLLGMAIGVGLLAHVLFGFAFGLSASYILLVLVYTVTAFIILQLHIKHVTRRTVSFFSAPFVYRIISNRQTVYGFYCL
ncbi:unnamed protein product [Toxocara canis]|uniref:Uncharacterized protein n=1 Tax=Toxocara canis TaxID=6265 RepID=A0A183U707_TOXCA|nr:unnamed protein product [Toxocara canis]